MNDDTDIELVQIKNSFGSIHGTVVNSYWKRP